MVSRSSTWSSGSALALLLPLLACGGGGGDGDAGGIPDRGRRDSGPGADASPPDAQETEAELGPDDAGGSGDDVVADVQAGEEIAEEVGPDARWSDLPDDIVPVIETVIEAGAEGLPAAFDAGSASGSGPVVVYPSDETLLPLNVAPVTFQWEGPSGGRYHLVLRGPATTVEVFTTDWQWTPDAELWTRILLNGAGERIEVEVDELVGGLVERGTPIDVEISFATVKGAIYYWAPTSSAIVRLPVGATAPEVFLPGTIFSCAGCHALSPDGSRIAYTRGAGTPLGGMGVVGTDLARTVIQPERINGYYPTFAPDNVRIAVGRAGSIVVVDTDTGTDAGTIPKPAGTTANYPSWSPRDEAVVFAAGPGGIDPFGLGVSNAGIARSRWDGGAWQPAEWLVEAGEAGGPGENLFYPAYSPDGAWVAFNRAMESVGPGASPAGSEVWIVNAEGTGDPIRLTEAHGPGGTTNSWPKWAPATGDGRLWIAFTSIRPYGRIETGGSQIWIAGLDITQAEIGIDPSRPAFWMPYQELGASNHIAYWAEYTKEDEAEEP